MRICIVTRVSAEQQYNHLKKKNSHRNDMCKRKGNGNTQADSVKVVYAKYTAYYADPKCPSESDML